MSRFKKIIKSAYARMIFSLSANDSWLYRAYVSTLHPKPGSFDYILQNLSRSTNEFHVIQVGANDGITHDPIHKFIRRYRWSGLLIEPQPYVFNNFLRPLHQRNDRIQTVNAAIGNDDGSADIHMIGFSNDRWATGLARFDRDSLYDLMASGGLNRRLKKEGLSLPANHDEWIKSESIQLRSFSSLFSEYEINSSDLLMIDTEGFDFEILKMFPWSSFKPSLVAYECFHLSEDDLKLSVDLLSKHGYRTHRDGPNIVAWLPMIDKLVDY